MKCMRFKSRVYSCPLHRSTEVNINRIIFFLFLVCHIISGGGFFAYKFEVGSILKLKFTRCLKNVSKLNLKMGFVSCKKL